jgi:hypothetical protein
MNLNIYRRFPVHSLSRLQHMTTFLSVGVLCDPGDFLLSMFSLCIISRYTK